MRRLGISLALGLGLIIQGPTSLAQTPIDELEKDLTQVKQQHDDATSQAFANTVAQLDSARSSSDAAVALYQQAGGIMPAPAPVTSQFVNETPDERAVREAQDKDAASQLGETLRIHCGLMRFAVIQILKPDQKGLHDDWVAWLKSAAQTYPQLKGTAGLKGYANAAPPSAPDPSNDDGNRRHKRDPAAGGDLKDIGDWKRITLQDSIISKYLAFQDWNGKDQAGWAVNALPQLFRTNVLDPLRAQPTTETLAAWDTYIAMRNADETDNNHWNHDIYPELAFDRGSDDYAVKADMDKLVNLVNIIKANPTNSKADDWIAQVHQMMQDYRSHRPGATATGASTTNAPSAAATGPNVTVTTTTQGDMTIITTHTNSAPVSPPAPTP